MIGITLHQLDIRFRQASEPLIASLPLRLLPKFPHNEGPAVRQRVRLTLIYANDGPGTETPDVCQAVSIEGVHWPARERPLVSHRLKV